MTDIIARRESPDGRKIIQPLAVGEQHSTPFCSTLSASECLSNGVPGDSRRAIMFVAFGDWNLTVNGLEKIRKAFGSLEKDVNFSENTFGKMEKAFGGLEYVFGGLE